MPLRDHFRPPLDDLRHWESLLAGWPIMIVASLRQKLPRRYLALPRVHSGTSDEIDVATFENEPEGILKPGNGNGNGGGIATAVWAPPRPTLAATTDLPTQDEYEVRVYDEKRHSRLVAAVEIVSPANKDRPEHRRVFVSKCAALLRERVSVVIVDVVTTRTQNLYGELLDLIGQSDPALNPELPLYATACRLGRVRAVLPSERPLFAGVPADRQAFSWSWRGPTGRGRPENPRWGRHTRSEGGKTARTPPPPDEARKRLAAGNVDALPDPRSTTADAAPLARR